MSKPRRASILVLLLALLTACAELPVEPDELDGGTNDASGAGGDGAVDVSAADASSADASSADAGVAEAGPCESSCEGEASVCEVESGACVECLRAEHCDAGGGCVENVCQVPGPDPDPEPVVIRFASYNVRTSDLDNSAWGDRQRGFDDQDAQRMARVADTIAAQNLTVVSAQEVHRPERNAILDRLRTHHEQAWGSTEQRSGNDSVVFFRRDVWRKVAESFFATPVRNLSGPGTRTRHQVRTLLEHDATGTRVWFYSVHFSAGAEFQNLREEAARRTVESIEGRNHAFVLGGDFNTTGGSSVGDIFSRSGFMKYTRRVAERVVNDHCTSHNNLAGSAGRQSCPGAPARQIDHVWVSRSGMRVLKHQLTASERTSRASDHNPITAILHLTDSE